MSYTVKLEMGLEPKPRSKKFVTLGYMNAGIETIAKRAYRFARKHRMYVRLDFRGKSFALIYPGGQMDTWGAHQKLGLFGHRAPGAK